MHLEMDPWYCNIPLQLARYSPLNDIAGMIENNVFTGVGVHAMSSIFQKYSNISKSIQCSVLKY